jgi:hypothetical protein
MKERDANQTAGKNERQARNKSFSEKQDLGASLVSSRQELEHRRRSIAKQEERKSSIEVEKAKNDQVEATRYVPAKQEAENVRKEIAVYKTMAEEIEQNTEKASIEKTKEEVLRSKKKLEQELPVTMKELEQKRETQVACTKQVEEYELAVSCLKKLEEETETLHLELAELESFNSEQRSTTVRLEIDRKLQVLRQGASLLKAAAKKEAEYEADL